MIRTVSGQQGTVKLHKGVERRHVAASRFGVKASFLIASEEAGGVAQVK